MGKKPIKPSPEEVLLETHRFLKIQLVTLHTRWQDYKNLYGHSQERVELLNQCAGGFFHSIQFAMLQQIELCMVRLLDPHKQGKSNKNMTFQRLVHLTEVVYPESQVNRLRQMLDNALKCSSRLQTRRRKVVAHLDVQAIQNEDQVILEWPRIEEVDASLEALVDLANAFEQMSGLPIMCYDLADTWAGSEAVVNHLTNSLRLKQLVKDGALSRELAYPSRFCSKNSQATR
jgi:hypothetical protein